MNDLRDVFFDELFLLAKNNSSIVLLTADMGAQSLEKFQKELPKQFFNVGISEQNLISVAAGLALAGKKVYVYTISAFLIQRALDQIKVDLCGMNLPVVLVGVGGGISYSYDAFTHHIPQDIAIMNSLPNMIIRCPYDLDTTRQSVICTLESKSPCYIRLEKGDWPNQLVLSKLEGLNTLIDGTDTIVITYGRLVHEVLAIVGHSTILGDKISCAAMEIIKPFPEEAFIEKIKSFNHLIIVEEHSCIGGLSAIISEILVRRGISKKVSFYNLLDKVCNVAGDEKYIRDYYGLNLLQFRKELFNES
ncbi:MAG: transketolase C-terminal domain-containing protein [Methanogenium sp.]|jgi:transketolase